MRPRTTARDRPDAIVAAVVHRRGASGHELLLVRTRDGRRWTFPKGHVREGESEPDAVARELLEESGARGDVATTSLTTYRYPPSRRGQRDDSNVVAYLVDFASMGQAAEGREAGWFAPEAARRRLAEGRSPAYAREASRVVDAALEALSG